ncbi:hypothetical protein CPB84DRAFT_1744267 [Gymnopilus junonius]|uniref:F-box domain-containing protein n=1 Tax=Gymnopilus junonius TaxID=109634 RepID=A0A9P5NZ19_GYMJU|nr:hypothetical protein CPB84DRAFT_1744267 [Gymnopilus junonius]
MNNDHNGNPTRLGLGHLPSELIVEIFKEVAWKDVLSIRKTCRRFCELSKTLSIWKNQFLEHDGYTPQEQARNRLITPTLSPRLERLMESYTSPELEHLFLRWQGAEIGWSRDDKFPVRQRSVTLRIPQSRPFLLIEGGRWVLFATTAGSVEYVDLDAQSEDMVERLLVPKQTTSGASTKMAVDIDDKEPVLTFNLALSISTRNEELLQIWKVVLEVDEKGRGVGLSARHVASYSQIPNRPLEGIAIGGPYFVYYFWLENHDPETHFVVVNWQEALASQGHENGLISNYSMRIISNHLVEKINAVYFLEGNKLFISTSNRQLIYNIESIPISLTFQIPPGSIPPLLEVLEKCSVISNPFIFPYSVVRFSLLSEELIKGMNINFNSPVPSAQIYTLKSAPITLLRGLVPVLGYKRGVFMRRHGGVAILSYPWPGHEDFENFRASVILKDFSRENWAGRRALRGGCVCIESLWYPVRKARLRAEAEPQH